jgi:CRP-like cAMP-binding protein
MIDRIDHDAVYNHLHAQLRIESAEARYKLREFSRKFVFKTYEPGDELWSLTSTEGDLHVILTGAFGEYLKEKKQAHLLRFYHQGKCAFSEDLLLYSNPPETITRCLVEGKVASIPRSQISMISEGNDFGLRLISGLINLSMTEYRYTTYEMLQTSVEYRIKAALEQFPELLNVIPRRELADYLGISKASLFRTLKILGDAKG